MKIVKIANRQHDIASIQKLFAEHKNDTIFLFNNPIFLNEKDCIKLPLILSNTDYTETKNVAIHMENMKNITLDFNGQTLECSGQLQPLTLIGCENITIKNLIIDWTVPLSAESEVVDSYVDYVDYADYIDLKIDKDLFPFEVIDNHLYFNINNKKVPVWKHAHTAFNKNTKTVVFNSGDRINITHVKELTDDRIRIFGHYNQIYESGTIIVLRHSEREHAGIFAEGCKNISFENIQIHATGGLGILCQFNENLYFNNISFCANEKKGRKIVCGHDDGLHLVSNKGEIIINKCYFNGLMDDPVNVHGIYAKIVGRLDNKTLRCNFVHPQAKGFKMFAKKGDIVSFVNHICMDSISQCEVEDFIPQGLEFFTIKFKENIPPKVRTSNVLENMTNTANLICRNNFFGSCRARGLLVSTPKSVIVEDNIFETAGSAILIAGDANGWFESGACHDVTIRNNTFMCECLTSTYQFCEAIISICPEIPSPDFQYPYHRNINIESNNFNPFAYSLLFALSTENLKFIGNKIYRNKKFQNRERHNKNMFMFKYCKQIQIKDNILIGDILGRDIKLDNTPVEEIIIDQPYNDINIVN